MYDGLGSVVGEVDPNGNLTSSPKYDVYGLVRSNPGTASSAMGFVGGLGHLSEAGTGLIYMRARYYDPALGRFSSEDPGAEGSNWYIYAADSPTVFCDRTGTKVTDFEVDMGWEAAGTAFTIAALYFLVSKTVPGFKNAVARSANVATGLAVLGVFCFSEASLGTDSTKYVADLCYNVAALTPTIALVIQGGMETLGYCASVGVDS